MTRGFGKITKTGNGYDAEMRSTKLSSSTIRNCRDRLSQLHRFAVDRRYLMAEPCRMQRPKLTLKSGRAATSEAELEQALASCSDPELRAVLLLAADGGLRATGIVRLRGDDLSAGWITVAVRSESDRTKSGKARRIPLLTERLIHALAELEPQRNKPVVGRSYDQIAPRLKRFGIRLHELRHRFATRLLTAGEPRLRVQGWLGHADARTRGRLRRMRMYQLNRATKRDGRWSSCVCGLGTRECGELGYRFRDLSPEVAQEKAENRAEYQEHPSRSKDLVADRIQLLSLFIALFCEGLDSLDEFPCRHLQFHDELQGPIVVGRPDVGCGWYQIWRRERRVSTRTNALLGSHWSLLSPVAIKSQTYRAAKP